MCNFFSRCKFYVPLIIFNHSAQYSVEMNIQWVFKCLGIYPYNLQTESLFIIINFDRIAINLISCRLPISLHPASNQTPFKQREAISN